MASFNPPALLLLLHKWFWLKLRSPVLTDGRTTWEVNRQWFWRAKASQYSGEDTLVWQEWFKPKRCFFEVPAFLRFSWRRGTEAHCSAQQWLLRISCSKVGKKRTLWAPKICEVQNSFFWRGGMKKSRSLSVFWFSFSFKQNLWRSCFGGWQVFLLKVKPKFKTKCKFFNSAQVKWVTWSGNLSLSCPFPQFSKQRESGRHCPSPGCLPAPHLPSDREWNFEMRGFLLEMEWWHPDLSAQLLPPPLKWITYQSSHAFVCRQLQSSVGRAQPCFCSAGRLAILPGAWLWLFCFVWGYENFFPDVS